MTKAEATREQGQRTLDSLAARYGADIVGFAADVCGFTDLQVDFLVASAKPGARLAAQVEDEPIDRELAVLALHNLLCSPQSYTLIVVNHMAHAELGTWGQIRRIIRALDLEQMPTLGVSINNTEATLRAGRSTFGRIRLVSPRNGGIDAMLCGSSGDGLLCLMAEAGVMPDITFDSVAHYIRRPDSRWIMTHGNTPGWFMRRRHDRAPLEFCARGFTLLDVFNSSRKRVRLAPRAALHHGPRGGSADVEKGHSGGRVERDRRPLAVFKVPL